MVDTAPVFVVGMQRSGTTFLRLLLNRSDDLFIPFESDFLSVMEGCRDKKFETSIDKEAFIESLLSEPFTQKAKLAFGEARDLSEADNVSELVSQFFMSNARLAGKTRWGVKTPSYIFSMHKLLSFFPNAKIVVLIRDPRGMFLSHKQISWGTKDPVKLAYYWNQANQAIELVCQLFPKQVIVTKYEDLMNDTIRQTKRICDFINIDFSNEMLDYSKGADAMPNSSMHWHTNSVSQPSKEKAIEWQNSLRDVEVNIFQDVCHDYLRKWGYTIVNRQYSYLSRVKQKVEYMLNYG